MPQTRSLQPDEPRVLGVVPPVPGPTSELETRDSRDLTLSPDVQQLVVVKEEVLDPHEAEPLHVKEEEEELWISLGGEQLNGQKEAAVSRFSAADVTARSEDDEPESSQVHQIKSEDDKETELPTCSSTTLIKTESEEEDCGGPEWASSPDPDGLFHSDAEEKASDSSDTEVSDDDYWQKASDLTPGPENADIWKWKMASESVLNPNSATEKPFSCPDCGKQFLHKLYLQKHMVVHAAVKPFACEECGKRFNQKIHLTTHMFVHTGAKPFACEHCAKAFHSKLILRRHMRRVHTDEHEKRFGCEVCGKRFSERDILSNHMRVHTEEKPFSCSDCGKCFKYKSYLKGHMRVHTGEKPFICVYCGKRFSDQGNLSKHTHVHTIDKPFACSDCGKRFKYKSNLKGHMRVHTAEKPFSCSDCGKRFKYKSYLKGHMRVHTGEKPFACNFCDKRFNQSSPLIAHIRVHTGEKPFGCDVCGKRFTEQGNLSRHVRIHKKEIC